MRQRLGTCAEPGCPVLTEDRRCPAHRPAERRPNAHQRGYTRRWGKKRTAFLKKYPRCAVCGGRATEAHHQPDRDYLVRAGVPDPDAERYLVPLCKPHHSQITGRVG